MFFDPVYWAIIIPCLALSGWASWQVKKTFKQYSRIRTSNGMTGADVANRILEDNGIRDVRVEPVRGRLSDHYDPTKKVLRLSEPVYGSSSVAAFGVAAHEVGHAIQHARGYAMLKFRSAWVPMAGIGSNLGIWLLIIGVFMGGASAGGLAEVMMIVGVALFACTTLFTLVTLPVEFDASRRALATLQSGGYVQGEELAGARRVLTAAGLTYVAAFITSLAMLVYWVMRSGLLGGGE